MAENAIHEKRSPHVGAAVIGSSTAGPAEPAGASDAALAALALVHAVSPHSTANPAYSADH